LRTALSAPTRRRSGARTRGLLGAAFLAALAPTTPALAQAPPTATVTVRAESAPTGLPLQGVRIEANGVTPSEVSANTTADGLATLTLPLGTHTLTAERIGYAAATVQLRLAAARDTLIVIRLDEEAIEGEAIVVSSARTDRRIEDEPIRIEVVDREELEEKLLMTPGDIAMLLNETAGLRVQPTAPSLGGASVRIQGLRGRYTQILTDGMPLYGGQAGALGPLQVPPMDLARVEVIKGAASALYGPTALGGVVNLISRRPDPAREVILNQSTLDGTDLVGWLAGPLGSVSAGNPSPEDPSTDATHNPWGYTLLAGLHRQDYADVNTDGWADVPRFQRASLRPRLFWNDGRGSSAILTIGGMAENRAGGTTPGSITGGGTAFEESLDTRRIDAGLTGRKLFSDRRSLSARASASLQRHDHRFGEVTEDDEHRTVFAELALTGQDGRHLWVVGAALQQDGYTHNDLPELSFDYTVPALFAQDEVELADWFSVAGSLRLDHHSRFGSALSPRLSLLLRPSEWTARISGGTGFFAPTPFTEESEAVGLRRLRPPEGWIKERARSAMIDVGRELGPVEVNVSAFGSVIDDALQTVRNGDGTLTIRNADGPVETWGTEVFAALRTGPWRLIGSHAFLRSREPNPDGAGRREVPLTPRHSLGMVGAYEREDWGRIGVEAYYTGRQELDDDPYRARSRRHVIVGLLIDRRFGPFRLFLNAENILDTRQTGFDPLLRPQRTADGRWITDVWAPLEGRAFNGGIWVSF
jgi:iron complex outermembrane receptor protein